MGFASPKERWYSYPMLPSLNTLVPLSLIEELISLGMSQGADFAEVYIERSQGNSVALEEKKVRTAMSAVSLGVGIRVLAGQETGYAYSDDLEPRALKETARVAAAIARGGKTIPPVKISAIETPNRYPVHPSPNLIPPTDKIGLLRRGDLAAHAYDSKVIQVMGAFVDQTKDILIANSAGLLAEDRQTMCRMNFSAIVDDGKGELRTGFYGGGGRIPFAFFTEFSPEEAATEAARMACAQLGAIAAPTGPQTVVMSPGWSGVLLHEAVGHGLEADFIHQGTSLYAGKLGEQVASEQCTVIDSGTLEFKRGSLNIDDEGQVAKEKVLIEKGVLKGFMVDKLSSQIMNTPSTGSGRRQSYQHAPLPRMTNTYMAPGKYKHDEILQSVQNGLYCASLGGGQVDISNGNFVFEVREGYQIEGGKITAPVKNATLIGVGPEILTAISMVGDNPALDPGIGTCGKDGQSVPVGVGMPTVKIDNITVGGTSL